MPHSMDLLDKMDLRGSQVINVEAYRSILIMRRLMLAAVLLAWLGVALLIAALCTPNWAIINFINTELEHVAIQLGVWGEWRTRKNEYKRMKVEWIPHFPESPKNVLRLADADLKHYYRAQAAFGVISLVLLVATNCLAVYTFYHHRYVFKRLTACLYAVVAMCIVVTCEVLSNSVDEWNTAIAHASKTGYWDYDAAKKTGYSAWMAWLVVAICVFAFFIFFAASHKQKGEHAATAELEIEDRPIHVGR